MRPRLQSAATYPARSLHPQDTKGGCCRSPPLSKGRQVTCLSGSPRRPDSRDPARPCVCCATPHSPPLRAPQTRPWLPAPPPLSAGIHPAFDSAPGPPPVWPRPSPGRHTAVLLCVSLAGHLPAPPPGRGANGLVAPQQTATWHCGSTPENPRG